MPFEGNLEADVAPSENGFDTPGLDVQNKKLASPRAGEAAKALEPSCIVKWAQKVVQPLWKTATVS